MKKYILILIIILELLIIKIPKYVELNNLAIIEEIAVVKQNNQYTVILKEIIPIKNDQGIKYEYKHYQDTSKNIEKAYQKIIHKTKKKLYLSKTKSLITNMSSSKEIINLLKISPSTIHHTNDVYQAIDYSIKQS